MKEALKAIVIVVGILFIWSVVSNLITNNQSKPSGDSVSNTMRNSFVSGCKKEAAVYPTIDAASYCECAYNKMIAMYPDFATNDERLNRILKDGYNSAETDQMVTCIDTAQRSET